jgi:hypothetical protein
MTSSTNQQPPQPDDVGAKNETNRRAWELAATTLQGSLGYDPNKFYVRATDIKGHGERVSFKVPPEISAQIAELIFSKSFPEYRTPLDFWRDAGVHWLHHRTGQRNDPKMKEAVEDLTNRLALEEVTRRMTEDVEIWQRVQKEAQEALVALRRDEAWGQICTYLDLLEERALVCPEPYRQKTLALVYQWRNEVPKKFE